jgi:hypothetical protein
MISLSHKTFSYSNYNRSFLTYYSNLLTNFILSYFLSTGICHDSSFLRAHRCTIMMAHCVQRHPWRKHPRLFVISLLHTHKPLLVGPIKIWHKHMPPGLGYGVNHAPNLYPWFVHAVASFYYLSHPYKFPSLFTIPPPSFFKFSPSGFPALLPPSWSSGQHPSSLANLRTCSGRFFNIVMAASTASSVSVPEVINICLSLNPLVFSLEPCIILIALFLHVFHVILGS